MNPTSHSLLNEGLASLLTGGLAINVASSGTGNQPSLARGLGCCISEERSQLILFVLASQARALLEDVRGHGAVAVIFTRPSTHHAWQLKGTDAHVAPLQAGDLERVAAYREAFVKEVIPLGFNEEAIRTLLHCEAEDLVRVAFTPTSAFLQTPGLSAGEPLRDSA